MSVILERSIVPSPVGPLTLVTADGDVVALEFEGAGTGLEAFLEDRFPGAKVVDVETTGTAARALAAYFAGDMKAIDNVPVRFTGTPFQNAVWRALCEIPAGETRSYAQIAAAVGKPTATRAVGRTNGLNPVAIIVPCHRVIGVDGKLTGYGGGLERKRWLLGHEGVLPVTDIGDAAA